jgi:hypothetical protein
MKRTGSIGVPTRTVATLPNCVVIVPLAALITIALPSVDALTISHHHPALSPADDGSDTSESLPLFVKMSVLPQSDANTGDPRLPVVADGK